MKRISFCLSIMFVMQSAAWSQVEVFPGKIDIRTGGDDTFLVLRDNSANGDWDLGLYAQEHFNINETNVAPRFTILKGGKVGINQIDPSATLDVVGTTELNGNVGISTPSVPGTKLHVVTGTAVAADNYAIQASASTGTNNYGGNFTATGGGGENAGVIGMATGAATNNFGVFGTASGGTNNYAGYFFGNVAVDGTLSKSSGSFKIDHPLDPENKYLYHSFVESPDMMNVYNGNITTGASGLAEVELPTYFMALNQDFRYQLTVIGTFAQAIIKEEISNNRFIIHTDEPSVKVSWQVTGIRKDPYAVKNRIQEEVDKAPNERGLYLHPEAYGQPESRSIIGKMMEAVKLQREDKKAKSID